MAYKCKNLDTKVVVDTVTTTSDYIVENILDTLLTQETLEE